MKTIAIIPSRYGSSRLKGKPLEYINGKPMVQWVYEKVFSSKQIDNVYVATDDERIRDVVTSFGGITIMTSPLNRSGTDRVAEAADYLCLHKSDLIINIQGDQPLFDTRCLDDLIKPFLFKKKLQVGTLALAITSLEEINDPKNVKVTLDHENYALYFSRANIPFCRDSDMTFTVYKHLGIYAYRREFLKLFINMPSGKLELVEKLEQLRLLEYGYRIFVGITQYDSPEVDTLEDISKVELIMKSYS